MIVPDRGRGVDTPAPTGSPPQWLPVDAYSIPRELTRDPSWYPGLIRPKAGKVGTWDKIPANPQTVQPAKWSDPATRCTFDAAFMAYEGDPRFGCIGYMLHADAGVVGIDLDHSISPDGTIAPWAQQIVDNFPGAYWERSISGTGLRGFCRGNLGDVGGVRSKIEGCSVEVYADVRFLVVTGQAIATVEQLPELQASVDALRARLSAGRVRATGTAIGSGLAGPNTNPSAEVLAIVEAVMSGRHGQRLGEVWFRDELHVAGASEDDWALECEIAYQAVRLGHRGEALAQLVEQTMRAGPYRAKWDERRAGVTWLAQDVANAIATVVKRLGDRPVTVAHPDGLADVDDTTPTDETPAQIIARLERQLAEERLAHAQTRSVAAVQMSRIRASEIVEAELRAEIEQMHREQFASHRLSKCRNLTSSQRDTIKALAYIATNRAEYFGNDTPIITAQTLGDEIGKCESSARAAADAVCKLPGSPIKRVSKYRTDGNYGRLTTYKLAVREPAEILERFAVIAEGLEERIPSRPEPKECVDHPDQAVKSISVKVCERYYPAVERVISQWGVLCVKNSRIARADATVTVGLTIPAENSRIVPEDQDAARAVSMVQIPLDRDVDPWKTLEARAPVDFEERRAARQREHEQPSWLDQWPDDDQAQAPPGDVVEHFEIPAVFLQ